MKKLSLTVAAAAAVVASTVATQSRADETTTTTTQQPPVQTTQTAPAQPQQPVQSVTVQPQQQQPAGTTTTTAAPYEPAGSETSTEHRPNKTLLSTGVGLFVVSYVPSLVAGAVSPRDSDKDLFIPVVGPWMDLGNRGCDTRDCGSREDINKAMLITSGVVQGAGVLLGLGSLLIPETTTTTTKRTTAKAEVKVLPVSFGAGAGVGAIGRF